MNLLSDIKELVKDDTEHNIKIEVDCMTVRVLLDYDPSDEYTEKTIIPIEYTTCEEFAYIPDIDYRKIYNPDDFGITLDEIILIKNIMEYLESHKQEIAELCEGYSRVHRKI